MDKQKQIEEMAKVLFDFRNAKSCCEEMDCSLFVEREFTCNECRNATILVNAGCRKIPENAVVINKDENPCLSCPVPEDIQRDVDCSTICGAIRLGINWQNQCKVLVKENKQLTKALTEKGKEIAKKVMEDCLRDTLTISTRDYGSIEVVPLDRINEICENIIRGDKQ
jgi:hypothetical protein